jgi:hypothetical protein
LGPAGAVGVTGAQGATGHPGAQGAGGPGGPGGVAGAQGLIGPGGAGGGQGAQGAVGAQGAQGNQGAQGTGAPFRGGGEGPQGFFGPQGAQGTPGTVGPTGAQGFQGEPGVAGPQGPSGNTGAQGAQGFQGAAGPQGATGPPSVTCTFINFTTGPSVSLACANFDINGVYMQNGTLYHGNKYRDQTNCENSTDDFAGLFGYYRDAGIYSANFTTGAGSISSYCPYYFSDVNLKTKIETISDALEKIMKLEAVEYDWNTNVDKAQYEYFEKNKKLHAIGLIAQNVRLYFPEVISINPEGYYTIDYSKLNSVLVEAIKSQQVFIEDIKEQINELENKLS